MKTLKVCKHVYRELEETYEGGISDFRCKVCGHIIHNQIVNVDALKVTVSYWATLKKRIEHRKNKARQAVLPPARHI